jgi:hypothetical protein
MNLKGDKKAPLTTISLDMKRQMLSLHTRNQIGEVISLFVCYTNNHFFKFQNPLQYRQMLSTISLSDPNSAQRLQGLRISLQNQTVSWVKRFGSAGLRILLDLFARINNTMEQNRGPAQDAALQHSLTIMMHECVKCLRSLMNNWVYLFAFNNNCYFPVWSVNESRRQTYSNNIGSCSLHCRLLMSRRNS